MNFPKQIFFLISYNNVLYVHVCRASCEISDQTVQPTQADPSLHLAHISFW